jgi:site-specific recombinase XerD
MARAGIRRTPPTLPHVLGAQFTRDGGSALTLRVTLGHEKLKTAERYAHVATVAEMAAA